MRFHRLIGTIGALFLMCVATAADAGAYRNFRTAIYIPVGATRTLAEPTTFEQQFKRVSSQLKFDKVYIEAYRDRVFATDAELDAVKRAKNAPVPLIGDPPYAPRSAFRLTIPPHSVRVFKREG